MKSTAKLELLRESLPYIKRFKGKDFVLKLGGGVVEDRDIMAALAEEIALCHQVGFRLVIVHGGGGQMTELARKLGIPQSIVGGRRVTDRATLEVAKMVLAGKVNTDILSALRRLGVPSTGLSGLDGNIVRARKRGRVRVVDKKTGSEEMVDYGHVGDILEIDSSLLRLLLEKGYIPVISCLGADDHGNVFNINADTVAVEVAIHLQVEKLIILSRVDGIYRDLDDPDSKLAKLSLAEARDLLETKEISDGMIPKLASLVTLLERGVKSAHLIDGLRRNALLEEIFTDQGTGTMIHP